jgi:hypothetical protein
LIKRIPARKARTAHYHLQLKSNIKRQISARRYLKRKLRIKKTTIKKLDNLKKKKFFAKKNKKVNFLLPNCVLNAGNNKLLPELAFSTKTNSYNKNKITSSDIKKFNLFSTKNKDHIILNPNKRLLPLRTSKKKKLKEVPNASYKTNIFSRLNKKIRNLRKINLEQIGYKSNNKLFNNRYLKAAQNNFFYKPNYKNMIFVSDSNAIQQQNYNKLQQCNIVQKAQTFRRMYRGKISNQAQFRIKYNQTKRKQKVISQVKRATLLYNKIFNISQKRTAISALTPLPLNFTQKKITKVIKTKQKKIKTSQNLISEKYQITLFVTNKINKIFVDTISNLFRFVYRNKVLPINVNGFVWATY